jgi:hypothetical protein
MARQDDFLKRWFTHLGEVQQCVPSNDCRGGTLAQFAKRKVADCVPSTAPFPQTFAQQVTERTTLLVSVAQVTAASAFSDFLDAIYPTLSDRVLEVFRACAGAAFADADDFGDKPTATLYPDAASRTALIDRLKADMDTGWLPVAKQDKLRLQLAGAANTVKTSVALVAGP